MTIKTINPYFVDLSVPGVNAVENNTQKVTGLTVQEPSRSLRVQYSLQNDDITAGLSMFIFADMALPESDEIYTLYEHTMSVAMQPAVDSTGYVDFYSRVDFYGVDDDDNYTQPAALLLRSMYMALGRFSAGDVPMSGGVPGVPLYDNSFFSNSMMPISVQYAFNRGSIPSTAERMVISFGARSPGGFQLPMQLYHTIERYVEQINVSSPYI